MNKDMKKRIYETEYNRVRNKFLVKKHSNEIDKIKHAAAAAAIKDSMSALDRLKCGFKRIHVGLNKFQKKRNSLSKKLQPYYNNLNNMFK